MGQKEKKWVERQFIFDFPVSVYPELIQRLAETPLKLRVLVEDISRHLLIKKAGEQWSIQENAGHLVSVDDLFIGRLEDYENGLDRLRSADLSGRRTKTADYNQSTIEKILRDFSQKRQYYIIRLRGHPPEFFATTARHPRLKQSMRVCDMLYFQAEHDDHHLSKITHLIQSG